MSRKDKTELRNLGGTASRSFDSQIFDGPQLSEARTNVVMIERVILAILRSEIDRLRADTDELTRFFSRFFDPIAGPEERATFAQNFARQPPVVVLGYPRTTAEFPCISVILEGEEMTDEVLGGFLGETVDGEKGESAEYIGAGFDQTFAIYVFSEHPDVCVYLYHFVKMVMIGARDAFIQAGCIDPHYSGGEITPDEQWLPENLFSRVVRVKLKSILSVPNLLFPDPGRVSITGIFMNDIVVEGVRGGVVPFAATEDDSAEE